MDSRLALMAATLLVASAGLGDKALAQAERRQLVRDTVIDGIPCQRTGNASAEFHASGRLLECPLQRDTVMWGQPLPAGTWIRLHDDGSADGAWLSRDSRLSGIACRGDGYRKWAVRFHRNGVLSLCFLRHDTVIEGVPCLSGTFLNELRSRGRTGVVLRSDGRLSQCMAARAFTRGDTRYAKWDLVRLPAQTRSSASDSSSPYRHR
ncbi:hypothetical protein [Gemmatimonas sp.]